MKKIGRVVVFAMLLISSAYTSQAMAIGKGFYLQLGSGGATWDAEDDLGTKWSFDTDTSYAGIGFVLDTATADDRLFNYRFQVGLEKYENKTTRTGSKLSMDSLVIDQDFGFGLVRNERLRFWLGPELRISFSAGSPDNSPDLDIGMFGVGLGPAVGINIHTRSRLSLAFKLGYMAMSYSGYGDDTSAADNNIDYTVEEHYTFFNFAMLFR